MLNAHGWVRVHATRIKDTDGECKWHVSSIADGQVVDAQTKSYFLGEKLDDERPGWRFCSVGDTSGIATSSSETATTPAVGEANELTTGDRTEIADQQAAACIMDFIANGSAPKPDNMHIGGMLNHCDARFVRDWPRGISNKSQDRDFLAISLNRKVYFPHASRVHLKTKTVR